MSRMTQKTEYKLISGDDEKSIKFSLSNGRKAGNRSCFRRLLRVKSSGPKSFWSVPSSRKTDADPRGESPRNAYFAPFGSSLLQRESAPLCAVCG